ncbi:MAG: zinc transporter ZupT [Micrococcus sp.]|nr:zinc transporter ZupT [Micrococcus sp.]
MDPFWTAVALTTFAGAATALGGVLAVIGRPPGLRGMGLGLGLAAGVMLAVSFLEILPKATEDLTGEFGRWAGTVTLAGFLFGVLALVVVDRLVPRRVDLSDPQTEVTVSRRSARLMRLGLVTALGMSLHNLPEGFATFAATLNDPSVGVALAIAMAIHNVPEGLAVAVPIRQATNSRRRALFWASVTGVAEPVGALVGYFLLAPIMSDTLLGFLFAAVAGLMVVISLDKLLPTARESAGGRVTLAGLVIGMVIMMVSLDMLD